MSAKASEQEPISIITSDMAEVLYFLDRGNTITNVFLAFEWPDPAMQFCVSLGGKELMSKQHEYHSPYIERSCDFSRIPIAFAAITKFIEGMSEEDRRAKGLLS